MISWLSPSGHVLLLGNRFVDLPKHSLLAVWTLSAGSAVLCWRSRTLKARVPSFVALSSLTTVSLLVTDAWRKPAEEALANWHPRRPTGVRRATSGRPDYQAYSHPDLSND